MRKLTEVDKSPVVRSTFIRKLSMPTYEAICDYNKSYDFSLEQMNIALQYVADKFEHASLAMGKKTNVKSVEAKSSHQKQKSGQLTCSYCSSDHKAVDCTKYKTINARKDCIIAQGLCFNCLGVGHSSKYRKSVITFKSQNQDISYACHSRAMPGRPPIIVPCAGHQLSLSQ